MADKITDVWKRRDLLRAATGAFAVNRAMLTACNVTDQRPEGLPSRQFGARFDGHTDDSLALQRGIDEAARLGRTLILPAGAAPLGAALDLRGRHIAIVGSPVGRTVLRAARQLPCLLDADEEHEVIDSPLYLFGLTLDGAGMTAAGLRLRYRHRTVFDTVTVTGSATGVDERDSWLGRRINCMTRGTGTGWRLRGANHSSVWLGCSFTDARIAHIDIGADGTAKDGNDALLFQGCDVEYGAGHGVVVAAGATATFDTCYLGEGIGGDVLRNAGTVAVRGGALFVGYRADRAGIVPLGGSVVVADTSVRGQQFGSLDRLIGDVASVGQPTGQVIFRNVVMRLKLGGDPTFAGDPLGTLPMRVFAPILGKNWTACASDSAMIDESKGNERRVRCTAVTGSNPLIGLGAQLRDKEEARRGGVAYVILVYSATKPVELKFTSGAISRAPWRLIGTLPATGGVSTYLKADVPVEFADYSSIELIMRAGAGDEIALHHATISDSAILEPGPMANLAKAR